MSGVLCPRHHEFGRVAWLLAFGLSCACALADVHYASVSSPTPAWPYTNWTTAARSIQKAVDAAVDGDVVQVARGTYVVRSEVAITKGVCVKAVSGPALTVVKGGFPATTNRCFYLNHRYAVVDSFTITNGCVRRPLEHGGGVFVAEGSVVNCVIVGNTSGFSGGGVYGGSVVRCTLSGNRAVHTGGGVSNCRTVRRCVIQRNRAAVGGGVGACDDVLDSTVSDNSAMHGGGVFESRLVQDCLIRRNSAIVGGGAFDCDIVRGCTVTLNTADRAAGVNIFDGKLEDSLIVSNTTLGGAAGGVDNLVGTVVGCTVRGNTARDAGGVVNGIAGRGVMRNCLVFENRASGGGGGVVNAGVLENCTIVANSAAAGGGISNSAAVRNCIIYYNVAGQDSNVRGVGTGVSYKACCAWPGLVGVANKDTAPSFVGRTVHDYRLTTNSPCIDAGVNLDWMYGGVDLAGAPRIQNGLGDMGAYESAVKGRFPRRPAVRYVSTSGSNVWPYASWTTAARSIQAAVSVAGPGDVVLVAAGTYRVTTPITLRKAVEVRSAAGPDRTIVHGGYPAVSNRCFLLDNAGASVQGFTISKGVGHVDSGGAVDLYQGALVNCRVQDNRPGSLGAAVRMDGGTVWRSTVCGNWGLGVAIGLEGVLAESTICDNRGGGVDNGWGLVRDCTITRNLEGGIFNSFGRVEDCLIEGNRAPVLCAGLDIFGGTAERCTIVSNVAGAEAGVSLSGGGVVRDCLIMGNRAGGPAAGISIFSGTLLNSAVIGNSASGAVAGVQMETQHATVRNCLIAGNSSPYVGGVVNYGGLLENCTVAGNASAGVGGLRAGAGSEVWNCIIRSNSGGVASDVMGDATNWTCRFTCASKRLAGRGNTTVDPRFVAPGNWRLVAGSPLINAGRNGAWMYAEEDLDGKPRILQGKADVGAYEFGVASP